MKVLQVCPYDINRMGGVQRHILDLSWALAQAGHEVTVVAPGAAAPTELRRAPPFHPSRTPIDVYHLGRSRAWRMHGTTFELTWASRPALQTFARRSGAFGFDVAHFHTMHVPFMPYQLFRRLESQVARRIVTFHDTPPPTVSGDVGRRALSLVSAWLSRRLDVIIPVSESVRGHLRAAANCEIVQLPPCVDLSRYLHVQRDAARQDPPIVLFVGRLEPRKGPLLMIEAFRTVRHAHPTARLILCGAGPQRGVAEALVTASGLGEAVTFTGALSEDEKLKLYARADVFCAPSPYGESYGIVLAEAMAAGLPIVAADNPGYRTLLRAEGRAGLVAPGDVSALADRLCAVIESPPMRRRLAAWGRSHAAESDVTARLPDFLRVYASAPRDEALSNGLRSGYQRSSAARR